MQPTREQRVRMERAHVLAWPALQTARIDGWLWRGSGGGSQRANSVSTIDFTGNDPLAVINTVEARYHAIGGVARFQTFDETQPPMLPDLLRARGYRRSEDTTTMFKRPQPGPPPQDVEQRDAAWPAWLDTYTGAITPNRRMVNTQILAGVPAPRRFFGCGRDGRIVATGLCVVGFGCAVVECVATRGDARRQGAAAAVMGTLEAWAATQAVDLVGLQVVSSNTPAVELYGRLGYTAGATNCFWVREGGAAAGR
jgi:ribosomal protein S18 acetylase RimI-like enzyme